MTEHLNIPLIVDIDDNIWEVKEDNPAFKDYEKGSLKLGYASTFVSMADGIICSTQPLADYIKARFGKAEYGTDKIFVLPNCIDVKDFNFPKAKLNDKRITIGWHGSITHQNDIKMVMPAIALLLAEYPNLYFELLGGITKEQLPVIFKDIDVKLLDRVACKGGTLSYDGFPELLSQQKWHIAIAPITDDLFNRSKSHIKWMEYAMYKIPCVASNVYPYREPIQGVATIINELTGLLAEPKEWYAKLKDLIDNKDKRETIGQNAYDFVVKNWDIKKHAYKWDEVIKGFLKQGK